MAKIKFYTDEHVSKAVVMGLRRRGVDVLTVPEAGTSVKVGYEISFTRYFYTPQPLRSLDEIRADILALEQETEGLLDEIIGDNREP